MELDPNISIEKLKHAWKATQQNFEMLRTGFVEVEDKTTTFAMVTYGKENSSLPWFYQDDIQDAHLQQSQERVRTDIYSDLKCPPWQLTYSNFESKKCLQLSALHAIYDALSMRIILNNVNNLYNEVDVPSESPIEPVLGRNLDFSSGCSRAQSDFWRGLLSGAHLTRFPNLTPSRVDSTASITATGTCSWPLSRLEGNCKELSVSLQAAGQAAWARVLSAYLGEPAVTFGLVLSGRLMEDNAERVVFPCISTLPMHCQLKGNNQELLSEVSSNTKQLLKFQSTPLSTIQRLIERPREPLFDSLFAYQKIEYSDTDHRPPWTVVEETATSDVRLSQLIKRMKDHTNLIPGGHFRGARAHDSRCTPLHSHLP